MLSKLEMIKLSRSNEVKPVKEMPEAISVGEYGITEGENPVLYIEVKDYGYFATNSKAFIETFIESVEALEEEHMPLLIGVTNKLSKSGRAYRVAFPSGI